MKLVRNGITRDVLLIGRWAVKFPNTRYSWRHFIEGILANLMEASTWYGYSNSVDAETRTEAQKLCPVVWCSWGGWILVMRRAEPLNEPLSTYHIPRWVKDIKDGNFGTINGHIVCLDYA